MRSMSGVAVLALAFLVSSTAAFADTVTFNAGVNGSTSYTEAGMVFETGGEFLHFTNRGGGDLALDNSLAGHGIGIHLTDWSHFTLNCFQFLGGGDGQITFYDGAAQVGWVHLTGLEHTFNFAGNPAFAHINYMNFCGMCVSGFNWTNAIDNIDFTPSAVPVPEPGTLVLISAGVAGLGYRFRREKNKEA